MFPECVGLTLWISRDMRHSRHVFFVQSMATVLMSLRWSALDVTAGFDAKGLNARRGRWWRSSFACAPVSRDAGIIIRMPDVEFYLDALQSDVEQNSCSLKDCSLAIRKSPFARRLFVNGTGGAICMHNASVRAWWILRNTLRITWLSERRREQVVISIRWMVHNVVITYHV